MSLSKAARALRRQLRPTPPAMNQLQLAKELGVSQQAVSAWTTGVASPKPELMARIETLLGIPMREWVEEADEDSGPLPDEEADLDDEEPPRKRTGTDERRRC